MTRAARRTARLRASFVTCAVALLVTLTGCGSATDVSSATDLPTPAATAVLPPGPTAAASVPARVATGPLASVSSSSAAVPAFSHIYLIVMENKEYGSIVGSSHAPYLNALIREYGLATNDDAVAHPSEPNYLALFGGSTFGIRDDGVHGITARNLGDQLDAHGRTWHVYAQDLPAVCSRVASAAGGVDLVGAAGSYVRKHEPAISFTDIAHTSRCARITHLSGFNPVAASFELIVPNMINDMHDGSIAQGDAFLRAFMPRISGSAAFAHSLVLITWDEGTTSIGGGGHVATIVVSPSVPHGRRSSVHHTHYSILRTIEDAWGLGCLANSCSANDLREFFG
jgi:phosphatidylinositol-3-phosphatase